VTNPPRVERKKRRKMTRIKANRHQIKMMIRPKSKMIK